MNTAPESSSATEAPAKHRCAFVFKSGRHCRNVVTFYRAAFCHRHEDCRPSGQDDVSIKLTQHACNFLNPIGIHASLCELYTLVAAGEISPRRAAVLAYISSLLLRTLPAIYDCPHPHVGAPGQRPSNNVSAPKATPPPRQQEPVPPIAVPTKPTYERPALHNAPSARTSALDDELPPGNAPLPATREEFANLVLKRAGIN